MSNYIKYMLLFVLIGLLVLIRFYEDQLFYDPYGSFFQNDYLYIDNPRREVLKLIIFTTFRFVLNTIISLGVMFVVFRDWSVIKFSGIIYTIAYIVFIALYLYFVLNPRQEDYYLFFNIRRFLIQPIILILLLPAFYYHKIRQ